ncbi:MAG TPA: pentapeptide repeat-containing protein, partial [Methylomirabilota bacterium]|nr:pentapeptide repeat-containing protein [Methylomirabilota bacterium]
MASQEHLDILKQGVDAWNQWRRQFPNIQPDLSDADLSQTSLVILDGGDIIEINLSKTNLRGAYLFMTNLLAANLSGANLSGANLKGAQLFATDLSEADLSGATLVNTLLDGAHLHGANL